MEAPPAPDLPPDLDEFPVLEDLGEDAPEAPWRPGLLGKFPVTLGLTVVVIVFFGLEYLYGGTSDPRAHLRLGALWPSRVWEHGEYFRLLTCVFLHNTIVHLGLNWFAFLQLGALVEYLYGSWRLLAFYLLCGLGGSLASALFGVQGSVGASGAIMGLAGLLLGATWFGAEPARSELRTMLGQRLLFGVVLTFALGVGLLLVFPIVDNWGHAGGFFAGLVLSGVRRDPRRPQGNALKLLAIALASVTVVSFAWMALAGDRSLETYEVDMARHLELRLERKPDGAQAVLAMNEMLDLYAEAGDQTDGVAALKRCLARVQDPATLGGDFDALFDSERPAIVLGLAVVALCIFLWRKKRKTFAVATGAGALLFFTFVDVIPNDGLAGFLFRNQANRDRELEVTLDRWLEMSPDDHSARNSMAWHLVTRSDLTRRDPERALELSRSSLELIPDASAELGRAATVAYTDTLAEILYQQEQLDEALATQQRAVALAEEAGLSGAGLDELRARLAKIERAQRSRGDVAPVDTAN